MRKIFILLTALMLAAANFALAAMAEETLITLEDISALEAEIAALREEIAATEEQLKALEKQYAYENRDRDIIFPVTELLVMDDSETKLYPEVRPRNESAPATTELVWYSSNRSVARVNSDGVLIANKPGTAVITCQAADNADIWEEITVTVVQPVRDIEVSESIITLTLATVNGEVIGKQSAVVVAQALPVTAYDPTVTWKSADESVATVDNGLITAVGIGSTKISIDANDGAGAHRSIRVNVEQGAEGISLNSSYELLMNGDTFNLNETVLPKMTGNKEVVWSSDNESVAIVSQSGLVRSVGPGVCTISATTTDGTNLTASCTIEVIQLVKSIQPDVTVINLKKVETAQPVYTVLPVRVTDDTLLFSTDNPEVAVVDENGVITPVEGGTCHITAQAADGGGAKAVITVNVEPEIPMEIVKVDMQYSMTGVPSVMLELHNAAFDRNLTACTFAVRCTNAYGALLTPEEGIEFSWAEKEIIPDETWTSEEWACELPDCKMVWQVEAWLTSVTTADGDVITVTDDYRMVTTWTKY